MIYDYSFYNGDPVSVVTFYGNLILTFIIIFMERKQPSSTYAWLMFLWIFPIIGFLFYIMFSQKFSSRRIYKFRAQ